MMARSTRSNQRPDTLMQDRYLPDRRKPLAPHGRTIHWVKKRTSADTHQMEEIPRVKAGSIG
jgi:hypothetical protein